jgi:hypothetical protein
LKLKSFGCSFVYGTDLSDCVDNPSKLTWPALLAQHRGLDYQCCAVGGTGNHKILNALAYELIEPDWADSVYVIQWTWPDRFDYADPGTWLWQTIRPSQNSATAEFYYRHLHSDYLDIISSLQYMYTAQQLLTSRGCEFVMTCLDPRIMTEDITGTVHNNAVLELYRNQIKNNLRWFDGQGFLAWSRNQGFEESESWHPLDRAHAAAAKYTIDHWAWT